MKLNDIAYFVDDKISSDEISLNEYITTDCLLQNKKGRSIATNLPPQPCSLTKFKRGDILIGNIRPYLKKIWLSDIDGGCSLDVLALRTKNKDESAYLYSLLMQDNFYDFVMKAAKGSKMPRGDKNHILTFPCFDIPHKIEIGNFIKSLDDKIALNRRINEKLTAMAKRLYDHWFVQFDFPNADCKPYKASGGKMVWNETLKREIPAGWEVGKIGDFVEIITKGTTPSTAGFEFEQIGINFVKVECIENGQILTDNLMHISEEANKALKRSQLQESDILVTIAGRLGSSAIVSKNILPANTNQAVGIIRLQNDFKFLANYLYERIVSDDVQRHLQGANAQSIQKNLTLPNLAEIAFPYDKDFRVLSSFTTKTLSIFNYQLSIEKETTKLTSLRDRLLPLLMNGQVEVK